MADKGCVLCRPPSERTKIYTETDRILIVHCRVCDAPMGIFKQHDPGALTIKEGELMRDALSAVATRVFPWQYFHIDEGECQHGTTHAHWHIRSLGYFEGEEWRARRK